jgi:hypothetical protein
VASAIEPRGTVLGEPLPHASAGRLTKMASPTHACAKSLMFVATSRYPENP